MKTRLWLAALIALILATTVGCVGALQGGTVSFQRPQVPLADPSGCLAFWVTDAATHAPLKAHIVLGRDRAIPLDTNADGYVYTMQARAKYQVTVTAEGYLPSVSSYDVTAWDCDTPIGLTASHVDPSARSLESLSHIRGAMWTARYPMPWGPRPNNPTNILNLSAVFSYDTQSERDKAFKAYTGRGYTHGVIGPWRPDEDCGYHGEWPCRIDSFDTYLDQLQALWDAGITPVVFLKPDNWTLAQLETLTKYYATPRAQKLVRVIVPVGWEPGRYQYSNAQWIAFLEWAERTLPNALRLVHTECDVDGLIGGNNPDGSPIDGNTLANDEAWRRAAPHIHGWLTQSCAFQAPDEHGDPGSPSTTNFQNWVRQFDKDARGSYYDRFHNGYAGWPRNVSAWGNGVAIKIYAGEFAAYWSYHNNRPESEAQAWGDAAMRAGADGYLDGGTVDVPFTAH